jgi:hypothetical protein
LTLPITRTVLLPADGSIGSSRFHPHCYEYMPRLDEICIRAVLIGTPVAL